MKLRFWSQKKHCRVVIAEKFDGYLNQSNTRSRKRRTEEQRFQHSTTEIQSARPTSSRRGCLEIRLQYSDEFLQS